MIIFENQEIHRDKLFNELIEAGLELQPTSPYYCYLWREDGKVLIDSTEDNRTLIQQVLDNHDPSSPELSVEEKLNNAGLTIDELKSALGL
jgi:hypothetical protein